MHPPSARPRATLAARRARRGVTLIEVVVVLALLGVAAALAGPVLARPRAEGDAAEAVARARALALRRAETVRFAMDADGAWRAQRWEGARDEAPLLAGRARAGARAPSLRITPLGACLLTDAGDARAWDPLACAPAGDPAGAR